MTRKPLRFYLAGILGRIFPVIRMQTQYGFSIRGNTRDMVSRYIFMFGFWEPGLSAFIQANIGPKTHFYDLGTNIGFFSLLAASRGAKVHGFEAAPELAALCRKNVADAGLSAEIHNVAVAREVGELTLYDRSGPTNSGTRTIIPTGGARVHATVKAAPLRSIVNLDPEADNFFKIDIEGAELPVLEELAAWMQEYPSAKVTIVVELTRLSPELSAAFTAAGCDIFFLKNDYSLASYADTQHDYELIPLGEPAPDGPYETVLRRGV